MFKKVFSYIFIFSLLLGLSEASITRFEFIDAPNEGAQEVQDDDGFFGPTLLASFAITVVSTPADILFFNQESNAPIGQLLNVNIADPDEGIDFPAMQLLEGVTHLYPYAKDTPSTTWTLGPLTIDGDLPLFFIVDQGPPRSPEVGSFIIEGGRTANLQDANRRAFYTTDTPTNSLYTLQVVYNLRDIEAAGSTNISFIGTVTNNVSQFDAEPDDEPDPNPIPGAIDRPEALADVAAQLNQILSGVPTTGPPLSLSVISDVTTKTGPYPVNVAAVDVTANIPDFSAARQGPGIGLFNPLGFDFETVTADGNYEIIVGAKDAVNNASASGFVAFNNLNDTSNTNPPTRILVIKDTIHPGGFVLTNPIRDPEPVFIFNNTPPAVDPPFEDSIWSLVGSIVDERGELVRLHVLSQDSPDKDSNNDLANNNPADRILVSDPNSSNRINALIDANTWEPQSGTQEQVAYRFSFAQEDLHGNMNVSNPTELIMVKDSFSPQTPAITNLVNGEAITQRVFSFRGMVDNDESSSNAEHGRMDFVLTILNSTVTSPILSFTIPGSATSVVTNSLLDDAFLPSTRNLNINDPDGIFTGDVKSLQMLDRTSALNNMVPTSYVFVKPVNLDSVPDGVLIIGLCARDQVGNVSNPCTSVTVIKDTSGPIIQLDLPTSGPDDNYENWDNDLGNLQGSDDGRFLVSMISPEQTVDTPPGVPGIVSSTDPFATLPIVTGLDATALVIHGVSVENFTQTTMVRISGAHIPTLELTTAPSTIEFIYDGTPIIFNEPVLGSNPLLRTISAVIPLFDIPNDVEETINIQAFDFVGNGGPIKNISVRRDIIPPNGPSIDLPQILPGTSVPTIYTNSDILRIKGSTENDVRYFVMTPPDGAPAGFDIAQSLRIRRTAPDAVPLVGSDFDTITPVGLGVTLSPFTATSAGNFDIQVPISTIASSLRTPTTVVVQVIDNFHNTDPASSVSFIEVHRNTLSIPVDSISILNSPQDSGVVDVYFDSIGGTPGSTVFFGRDLVRLRLNLIFPMLEAPNLSLKQSNNLTKAAGKVLSNVSSSLGTMTFEYVYQVIDEEFQFDGPVDFFVDGGLDIFGNEVEPLEGQLAFVVDTVAPNAKSVAPEIILSPTNSVLVSEMVSARIDLTDFFKDSAITEGASGIQTEALKVELFGPLQLTPDALNVVSLTTFVPSQVGFEVGARVNSPLVTDGTYRFEFTAVDRVGNSKLYQKIFLLDRQAILEPLFVTTPQDKSFVNTMPFLDEFGPNPHIRLLVQDIELDFDRSDFTVLGPTGIVLETVKIARPQENSIIRTFVNTSIPATDGTSDGVYRIVIDAFDNTGNPTSLTHTFILDTRPPLVNQIFPANQQCVSKVDVMQYRIQEPLTNTSANSGIDKKESKISLKLLRPDFPKNQLEPTFEPGTKLNYLSEGGISAVSETVAFVIDHEGRKFLPTGGSYDGEWIIQGDFVDQASNASSFQSTFLYDSQSPTLDISNVADFRFITNRRFDMSGSFYDYGQCGFESINGVDVATKSLWLDIYKYDQDSGQRLDQIAGPIYSQKMTKFSTGNAFESIAGAFRLTGTVPGADTIVEFEWTLQDRVNNFTKVQRVFQVTNDFTALPEVVFPKSLVDFRGQSVQTFTSNPVIDLEWERVPEAYKYRVYLTRDSLTPTTHTTFLDLSLDKLKMTTDINLVQIGSSPISARETFFWHVEAYDILGGGPHPAFEDRKRFNRVEFDSSAFAVNEGQLTLLVDNVETPLNSLAAFIKDTVATFKWRFPEPIRITGNERAFLTLKSVNEQVWLSSSSVLDLGIETSMVTMTFDLPKKQINGEATLTLENFKDRAFNIIDSLSVDLKVDRGSDYVVKLFQNPVDPQSFTFVFKGIDYNGTDDLLLVDSTIPTPVVSFSQANQQGRYIDVVPLRLAISGAQTYTEGFAGSFRVDLGLVGDINLSIEAMDFRGNTSREDVFLHVVPVKFRTTTNQSVSKLKSSNLMYGERKNSTWDLPTSNLKHLEYLNVPRFPYYYFPKQSGLISVGGSHKVTDCSGLVFLQKTGVDFFPATQQTNCKNKELNYNLSSEDVNSLVLVRDTGNPIVELEDDYYVEGQNLLKVVSEDYETGVSSVSVVFEGLEKPLAYKDGLWTGLVELPAGSHDIQVVSKDYAKNSVSYAQGIVVQKSFGFERCNIYPSPIYNDGTFDCSLTQVADKIEWILYDASGDRVWYRSEQDMAIIKEDLDLTNVRGLDLSNGVYFLKVKIKKQDKSFKKIIKFALIR
ncbi:MAG: T9SS type A sorting domain-containing protein [Candidatus Cloacimonetes bacterium]|nr:T9SS type A sorting domain-containing protein [Candidatus Cloacimonadota bacterium]